MHYLIRKDGRLHLQETDIFPEELVEAVTYRCSIEDSRGHFGGASRLKLKLTPAAIQNPDRVLAFFQKYQPVLVRS